jgi:hypothetical protein
MAIKSEIEKALQHTIDLLTDAKGKYQRLASSAKDARISKQMSILAKAAEEFNAILSTPNPCCPEWPNVCGAECPADHEECD